MKFHSKMEENETIEGLRSEISALKELLASKEQRLKELQNQLRPERVKTWNNNGLTNEEIARYSRQIILPGFGVSGQLKLKKATVLVVGAGGLGKLRNLITLRPK